MNQSLEDKLEGVCTFYTETGTEGGYWAFMDSKNLYSNEGLLILENGDFLTIYDPNNKDKVVWSGEINLQQYNLFTEAAYGYWIHADQIGIERETWTEYFLKEYPARLSKK